MRRTRSDKHITFHDYQELLDAFTGALQARLQDQLISVVVHGSVVRGAATDESDIDLLIVQGEAPNEYFERLAPLIAVERELRKEGAFKSYEDKGWLAYLSYIVLSKEEARENRYLFLDMIDDSIILFDKDGFFKKRLKEMRMRLEVLGSKKVRLEDGTWYWDLKPDLSAGEVFEL